ncbi:MAG TPA: serine protease [Thermoleophilaceae bacterium]|nr:serine protease [Thermoleophilaceae bacterium]
MRGILRSFVVLVAVLAFGGPAAVAQVPDVGGNRVVGGGPATEAWPHMAALYRDLNGSGNYSFSCGASLIRSDWVLTAAHCVHNAGARVPASRIRLVLGRHRLTSTAGETWQAAEVRVHPSYLPDKQPYDVALIRLAGASQMSTIRIPEASESAAWAPGKPAKIVGWGSQFWQGPSSNDLREVDVHMISDADCALSYQFTFGFHPATQVCAGETTGMKDACQGDSGGPLLVADAGGVPVLAGAVSFGLACGLPTQYGVYARLGGATLRSWVRGQTGV